MLVDEAADLVARTPSRGHVVADEAQDLSPMMLRAVGRRCSTGSATVLGDLAQATTPWATRSWEQALGHLGKPRAHLEQLTRGFRVPGEVIDYAARLLPVIAPGLEPPTSVRRARGELRVVHDERWADGLGDLVRGVLADRVGSVGLLCPDVEVPAVRAALAGSGAAHVVLGDPVPDAVPDAAGDPGRSRPGPRRSRDWRWSPHRWPRGWSSTTWCCWSRPGSSPGRPTGPPACGGSTSA